MVRALLAAVVVAGVLLWWLGRDGEPAGKDVPEQRIPAAQPRQGSAPADEAELGPVRVGEVDIELSLRPVDRYGARVHGGGYREIVEAAAPGSFDANLARAAAEYAVQAIRLGAEPSDRVMAFLLHSAGAPEFSVARYVVTTSDESDAALRAAVDSALGQAPAGPGALVVGVGESFDASSRRPRRIAVLVARRQLSADGTARRVQTGDKWTVSAELLVSASELVASALTPDGRLIDCEVEHTGSDVHITVPAGKDTGTLWLSIDARKTPRGPRKLAQLSAEIGERLPRRRTIVVPPDEEWTDPRAAESYVLELINRDRRAHGLAPLAIDPALSEVARGHSREMRERGYFGHVSPHTGSLTDRLAAADYPAAAYAENLARNDRVAEAHASLMWSVGHRKNLLSSRFDRVGIGAVPRRSEHHTDWFVTEVFARRQRLTDPQMVREAVIERIERVRERDGLPELSQRPDISELVDELLNAGSDRAGDRDQLVAEVGRGIRPHLPGTAQIVLFSTTDPDRVALPALITSDSAGELAVGVSAGHGAAFTIALVVAD